jgi:hypothetical protein
VAWTYTGLNPEEMEGRVTTVYERVLTTLVDNIEHIESTTVNGTAIVKIYLQPNAKLGPKSGMTGPCIAKSSAILRTFSAREGSDAAVSLCPFLCPCSFKIDRNGAQRIAIRRVLLGA